MPVFENQELSPREYVLMENERDEARLLREHAAHMKELELAVIREKNQAEVAIRILEAKWSSWMKIPITIIKLPLYAILAIGYIMLCITKQKAPMEFWKLIK